MRGNTNSGSLDCYVPRLLLRRLITAPEDVVQTLDGTVVFVDISGFTRLSERLARRGREGAEQLSDAINACFSALLDEAYGQGGGLLKFGGDALLVWFEGENHALRASAVAVAMRDRLRRVGRIDTGASNIVLRMSVGVHSGFYDTFLVGGSHREFVIGGPAASMVVAIEGAAGAGEILLSEHTAELLPSRCLGRPDERGVPLIRAPANLPAFPAAVPPSPGDELVASCLGTALRAHVRTAPAAPEHRTVSVGFLQFGMLDELIAKRGATVAARALDELVRAAQDAADRYEVCFLGSDVLGGGGKLILSAGAPRAVGDDEERLLLALRQIVDAGTELPVKAGANRGQVFAGEIGPPFRRTYTLMGDAVNLAARLMSRAPWGAIYATEGLLARSRTSFETSTPAPFAVKGKLRPVQALEIGPTRRATTTGAAKPGRLPLIGRERELRVLASSLERARDHSGSLVEIVGETGSGKSRLLAEAHRLAEGMRFVHATCEAYTQTVPYTIWRDILRQLLDLAWDDPDEVVLKRVSERLKGAGSDLTPWLPLLAIAIDADASPTREVQELAEEFRVGKLHEVVLRFLGPELRTPTIVAIEHAHAMDEASAALLGALTEVLEESAWLVLVTRREADSGFAAPPSAVHLELAPLAREDALALAEATQEAHVVPPHLLEQAVERSGGSPEFLLDLLAAAAGGSESLPDSIDSAASARIDALDPGDRALVRRAAVLGMSFHAKRLREVLDPSVPEPDHELWRRLAGVFAHDPDGHVRFKRPALREVAYQGLPFSLRRSLHAVVARSLEAVSGRDVDADPAVLSLHWFLAGEHAPAWRYAILGAERAAVRFAHADAARLYRRALDAAAHGGVTRAELARTWEALGDSLRRTGERTAATKALSAARRLSEGDPIAQARICYLHARVVQPAGRLSSMVRCINQGLGTLEGVAGDEAEGWRARLLSLLAGCRQMQGRLHEAERLCRKAIAAAEAVGERRALARACYVLDATLHELDRDDEGGYSARALEILAELGDPEQEAIVLNNLGYFAYFRGAWDEATRLYWAAAESSKRAGDTGGVAYTECNVGEILSDQGDLAAAARHLERARRLWSATGDRQGDAVARLFLGRVALRDGRHEDGLRLVRDAAEDIRRFQVDYQADFSRALVAEAEAYGGDPEQALELAGKLRECAERHRSLLSRVEALALIRLGRTIEALEKLEAALAAGRLRGAEYDIALSLDLIALLDELDEATERERDALMRKLGVVRTCWPRLEPAADVALKLA